MSKENQPIHRLRIGNIGAAIFENKNAEGHAFCSVQINRSYRDGDAWNYTSSFGKDDLLVLEGKRPGSQLHRRKTSLERTVAGSRRRITFRRAGKPSARFFFS